VCPNGEAASTSEDQTPKMNNADFFLNASKKTEAIKLNKNNCKYI
jgi:hypothetical protein